MLSQSTRFSVGEQSASTFPIKALSYSSLPTSPRTTKHEPEINRQVKNTTASGKHVFIPQKDDTLNHRFRLRYSPCSDAYHREWNNVVVTRFGGDVHGWEKGVYSFESVERIVDAKKNLVYLERKSGCNTGILTWKMDFGCCGLIVDQVSIKVASHHLNAGEVLVMLSGDETKKTISHMEGLGLVAVNGFENSKSLLLSVHLIGETPDQQTRLFEKNILSKGEYPFDIKVTLKPPVEMYNEPVILLGLMFSYSQQTAVDRRHYRTHSTSSGRGFLHINIVQGKNMTSSTDAQVKCYLLPNDRNIKSCKTGRAKKSCSPVWDEYFVIDGVAQAQLRKKQLGIRVVNWHLGFNRKNSRLGELRIGSINTFDFQTLPSPTTSRALKSREEETMNEEIVYSPLVPVDEERQKKRYLEPPCHETDKKSAEKSVSDTLDNVFFEKDQSLIDGNNLSDDEWPIQNNNSCTLLENLKRLNSARGSEDIKKMQEKKHEHAKTDEDTTTDKNVKNQTSHKPRRPPPPNLLKLKDGLHPDSNSTTKQDQEISENNLKTSPRKVNTPTMSRLMMKLPMSPRRDRRSSWGGESDMSLASPRSARSPSDYEGLESRQWDFMISRPKEWIYCWQKLDVNSSE